MLLITSKNLRYVSYVHYMYMYTCMYTCAVHYRMLLYIHVHIVHVLFHRKQYSMLKSILVFSHSDFSKKAVGPEEVIWKTNDCQASTLGSTSLPHFRGHFHHQDVVINSGQYNGF